MRHGRELPVRLVEVHGVGARRSEAAVGVQGHALLGHVLERALHALDDLCGRLHLSRAVIDDPEPQELVRREALQDFRATRLGLRQSRGADSGEAFPCETADGTDFRADVS